MTDDDGPIGECVGLYRCCRCGVRFSARMMRGLGPSDDGPVRGLVDADDDELASGLVNLDTDEAECFTCSGEPTKWGS